MHICPLSLTLHLCHMHTDAEMNACLHSLLVYFVVFVSSVVFHIFQSVCLATGIFADVLQPLLQLREMLQRRSEIREMRQSH